MISRCHLGTRLLPPDLECLVARTAVLSGGHQVPPWTEVTIDHRVRREEPLNLFWLLEALHLAFSTSCRAVGILSTIVQVAAGPMLHTGQDLALGDAILTLHATGAWIRPRESSKTASSCSDPFPKRALSLALHVP